MNPDTSFWQSMTQLLKENSLVIDRPRGSTHPRYPQIIYPLNYGYLENTRSSDGDGIDVWVGSLNILMDEEERKTLKRDAEIKLLIECSAEDIQIIRDFHKEMHTLYIPNPAAEHELSN